MIRNENALVTGSSSGIGRATVIALAKEGYNVGIHYNNKESEAIEVKQICESYGVRAEIYHYDLRERSGAEGLIKAFIEDFKTVDVVINNAGGALKLPKGEFDDMPLDYWETQINLNLNSPAYISHYAVKNMKENGIKGRIVNISSVHSKVTWVKRKMLPYCSAKAGLNMLTSALGVEVAPYGIRVNCIAPGFIQTAVSSRYTDEQKKGFTDHIPAGILGTTDDIVPMVLFLVEPKNVNFIVGQTFSVDGGQSVTGMIASMKEGFEK